MATASRPVTNHAKQRLLERYGLILTDAEWKEARRSIIEKRALLMFKSSGSDKQETWAVLIRGKVVELIYDNAPGRKNIVTVIADPRKENEE